MSDFPSSSELLTISCGDCGGSAWIIHMERCSSGQVLISTTCADPLCVERKRLALGASDTQLLVWNEWDVTSSFTDMDPLETCTPTNPN